MSERFFSHDEFSGVTTYFIYDEDGDKAIFRKEFDAEPLVEANRILFNDAPTRWGEGQLVASIPIALYWDLKAKGIIDDQTAFKRWLNDPDNRFFRTRPGVI